MAYVKRLDVLDATTLADSPTLLVSWAVVRSVNRPVGRKPKAAPPVPAPVVTPVAA